MNEIQSEEENFLVIYNICEIKFLNWKNEPTPSQIAYWIRCIDSLLNQNYKNYTLVISGCMISDEYKNILKKRYGSRVCYNFYNSVYTLCITFNKTVDLMIKHRGEYDGYIYVDSGIHCENQPHVFSEFNIRAKTKKYAVITVDVDSDGGYTMLTGPYDYTHDFKGEDLTVPVGRLFNTHFQYYKNDLRKAYNKLMADIYRRGGTEWILPYMCVALHLKFIIMKDLTVHHANSFDGGSAGFPYRGLDGQCDFLYDIDIKDVILNDEAKALGLGYDDLPWGIHSSAHMPHNPDMFTEEGFAIKGEEMKNYIRDHFFLKKEQLDYDTIKSELILN